MSGFDRYDFFERLYFHELERKQQLEANISLPTGAIVAAFGVLGYYFTHFKFGGQSYLLSRYLEWIFSLSSLTSALLLFLATFWCFRAAVGSAYEYLPDADELFKYMSHLEEWHKVTKSSDPASTAGADFAAYLVAAMAKCSRINWQENRIRSEELHRTKRFTVLGLFALAVVSASYYIDFWFDPPTIPF